MKVYTNDAAAARALLGGGAADGADAPPAAVPSGLRPLALHLFGAGDAAVFDAPAPDPLWRHALVSRHTPGSQYESLVGALRADHALPDGLACVALGGAGFLGFRGRRWAGSRGNIQLSVHLSPGRPIARFESVFTALAAVAVIDALDQVPGLAGHARIRWVNDVLLGEAKVAGVLAHTQTRGPAVLSVVLGIGINVEVTPAVEPTPFVPAVTSVRAHAPAAGIGAGDVLRALLRALARGYRTLLSEGAAAVVGRYRARSAVLGRRVAVSVDHADGEPRVYAAGVVRAIGDGLELRLEGRARPITSGRLLADPACAPAAELLQPVP